MEFLEKDLEQIIYNADRELLKQRGLEINGVLKRQLRIGNYGVADLVSFSRTTNKNNLGLLAVTIYELKKDKIGVSAFMQALGYVKGISEYLEFRGINKNVVFKIVLIGKTIDKNSSFIYLSDFLSSKYSNNYSFLNNYTYEYNVDGIIFKSHNNYSLINNGFTSK